MGLEDEKKYWLEENKEKCVKDVGVLRKTPSKKVNINHNAMAMINEGIQVYGKGETNSVSYTSIKKPEMDDAQSLLIRK